MKDTTKRLRELLNDASPTPWVHVRGKAAFDGWPVLHFGTGGSDADPGPHYVSVMGVPVSGMVSGDASSDAELVAVMRNALPALLAVVSAAEDALRVDGQGGNSMDGFARANLEDALAKLAEVAR